MEACCKILFAHTILMFMGVTVKYPITVKVDNVGALILSNNTVVSQWTNDIAVQHHFIDDYVEDRTVKIQLFPFRKCLEYQFIKNLSNGLFELLTSRYVNLEKILKITITISITRK